MTGRIHDKIILPDRVICLPAKGNISRYFREYAEQYHPGINPTQAEYIVLQDGAFPLVFGILCILFGITLILAFHTFVLTMVMIAFILTGIFFCVYWKNSRIRYNKEILIHRDVLGREKIYHFDDLTGVTMVANGLVLIFGKQKRDLDMFLVGLDGLTDFIWNLEEERHLDFSRREKDLFNGNLLFPGQKVLTMILLVGCFLGLGLLSEFDKVNKDDYEKNIITIHDPAIAYDDSLLSGLELSRLELESDNCDRTILIRGLKEYGDHQEQFFWQVQKGATFNVIGYDLSSYFTILACTGSDGTVFLSMDKGQQLQRRIDGGLGKVLYFLSGVVFILSVAYIIIVRNLEKCPDIVIFLTLLLGHPSSNFIDKRPDLFADDEEEEEVLEAEKAIDQNNKNPET